MVTYACSLGNLCMLLYPVLSPNKPSNLTSDPNDPQPIQAHSNCFVVHFSISQSLIHSTHLLNEFISEYLSPSWKHKDSNHPDSNSGWIILGLPMPSETEAMCWLQIITERRNPEASSWEKEKTYNLWGKLGSAATDFHPHDGHCSTSVCSRQVKMKNRHP